MISNTLIVTGMHRSGTSLMAHYLAESGLFMGEELLDVGFNRSQVSYRGHHEDTIFLDFHKRILIRKRISAFQPHRFRLPVCPNNGEKKAAIKMVEERSHLIQWGWKDPRTTLFLDFWNEVLDQPKYMFLLRHPFAVLESLLKRGNEKRISREPIRGLKVWRVYNQLILDFWKRNQQRSLICEIEDFIQNPEEIRVQLEMKLGIRLEKVSLENIFSQSAFTTDYTKRYQELMLDYPKEVESCMDLYHNIQKLTLENLFSV